jgi:hypothetical protein
MCGDRAGTSWADSSVQEQVALGVCHEILDEARLLGFGEARHDLFEGARVLFVGLRCEVREGMLAETTSSFGLLGQPT